jgi:sentrin-specific protease 1
VFNTYFFSLLETMLKRNEYDYKLLERIVSKRKVNLKNYKMLVVPMYLGGFHWQLLAVDMVHDKFYVVDSVIPDSSKIKLNVSSFTVFFSTYLHLNRAGRIQCEDNIELWTTDVPRTLPSAANSYDCGMFACLNMESLSKVPSISGIRYQSNDQGFS